MQNNFRDGAVIQLYLKENGNYISINRNGFIQYVKTPNDHHSTSNDPVPKFLRANDPLPTIVHISMQHFSALVTVVWASTPFTATSIRDSASG